jgi:coniferyl-aldehyde dehydrogenase
MSTGATGEPLADTEIVRPVPAGTDPVELAAILELQRQAFLREGPASAAVRRHRIDRLIAMILDNLDAYTEALARDFGTRSRTGTLFAEIMGMLSSVEHTRSNLRTWMCAGRPNPAARLYGIRAEVQPTPLGVVGVIGPWNFPLSLVIWPAASAFAAGNRVMIKMSEITAHTAELTRSVALGYFEQSELAVVTGGPDVASAFAELPFDHLFFTGSTRVGRLVQQAAAKNLVPVTLELGGKNPVVVAPDADMVRAATRIARARMVNGGQVCVCPDYVFVPADRIELWESVRVEATDRDNDLPAAEQPVQLCTGYDCLAAEIESGVNVAISSRRSCAIWAAACRLAARCCSTCVRPSRIDWMRCGTGSVSTGASTSAAPSRS